MKHLFCGSALIAIVVLAGACDPERSPIAPSGEVANFSAQLLSANQPTLVAGAEANGTGVASMSVGINRGPTGAITSATADVSVTLNGYPASTVFSRAELYRGDIGSAGTLIADLGVGPGSVILSGGAGFISAGGIQLSPPIAQDLLVQPAAFFIMLSTVANPNGVARGAFVKQ
jgi:hypothetical protein